MKTKIKNEFQNPDLIFGNENQKQKLKLHFKEENVMQIFETRYKADKEKKNSKWYSSSDIIVKVDGGYTIMTPYEYQIWKNQK